MSISGTFADEYENYCRSSELKIHFWNVPCPLTGWLKSSVGRLDHVVSFYFDPGRLAGPRGSAENHQILDLSFLSLNPGANPSCLQQCQQHSLLLAWHYVEREKKRPCFTCSMLFYSIRGAPVLIGGCFSSLFTYLIASFLNQNPLIFHQNTDTGDSFHKC